MGGRNAPERVDDFLRNGWTASPEYAITSRNGGRSLEKVVEGLRLYLLGWKACFRRADTPGIFQDLDKWIARRLRMVQLKQWKRGDDDLPGTPKARYAGPGFPSGGGLERKLVENRRTRCAEHRSADGVPGGIGTSEAGAALTSTLRTAGCGPACPVVWEGRSRDRRLPPIPIGSGARGGTAPVSPARVESNPGEPS
jgi:hypothetical protein